ncbi:hypothetical protein [Lewinella cohaerens]|uniref:hypothetical protein n=1 Tax=Lewinella cohaerens TaxID=70995 RepID=UPI0005C74B39|nr:hypothetical protein [Lewinella cohaerens]
MTTLCSFSTQAIRRFPLIALSIFMIVFSPLSLHGATIAKKENFALLTGLSLDGIILSDQVELAPIFKSCDPLSLAFTEMPGCSYLEFSLTTVDPLTGIPIYGPSYLDFQIIHPTGEGEISLKCLTDFVECRLFEPYLGQTFQISISLAGDDCVSIPWQEGYFQVFAAAQSLPNDLSLNFPPQVDQFETFFDCEPIVLSFTASGEYDNAFLEIVSINPNYGAPIYGSDYLDFSTTLTVTSGQFIDLNCIADPIDCNLFAEYLGGLFRVRIILEESVCGRQVSEVGYFRVTGAPTTSSIQLRLASGSISVYEEVTEVENASALGNQGGAFGILSTNGDIDSIRVTIQQIDCITGEDMEAPLLEESSYQFPTSPNAFYNFNSLEINGVQGYFRDNPEEVDGNCYRLEIIASNFCGAAIDSSFFFFDENIYLTNESRDLDRTLTSTNREHTSNTVPTKAQIVPQPAQQQAWLKLDHPYTGAFTLSLFSSTGKMLTHYSEIMTDGKWALPIDNFLPGLYYYQSQIPDQLPITGKLLRQ